MITRLYYDKSATFLYPFDFDLYVEVFVLLGGIRIIQNNTGVTQTAPIELTKQ